MNCLVCQKRAYSDYCVQHKPRKPIITRARPKQQSTKERNYQHWKETIARPYLLARDGNRCICCKRKAYEGEKLDIEHTLGKGAHPELKREVSNMKLMCRFPCHRNKTDSRPCNH